jgi:Domain of unknown function (DUF4145)
MLRCPVCLREGTLDQRGADRTIRIDRQPTQDAAASGERVCPNPDCRALIYIIYQQRTGSILHSYPAERIDFDASDLPDGVRSPLEEAIDCHAGGNYRAAAVMVRRALEAVCDDQGVEGKSLYKRVEGLGKKVTLPRGMIDSLHNLRLLGNDAAHVEAKAYDEVGKREVEIAVHVAKVILQAAYQMESILGELEALKSNSSTDAPQQAA